jgi:hypothetical protein
MAISPFNYRLDDHLNAGQSLWFLEKQILPTEADDDVANLSGGPLAAARLRDAAAVDSAANWRCPGRKKIGRAHV